MLGNFAKRNSFKHRWLYKTTFDMGQWVPFYMREVVPGDTFKTSIEALVRLSPLVFPTMENIETSTEFFFVPNRLVWQNFQDFITGGEDGTDATVRPTVTLTPDVGDLADYLGLPIDVEQTVSALPFRGIALIYNEWIRNQNIQDKIGFSTADGADSTTSTALLNKNWNKDYFTNCLPWPQRGEAVTIGIGDSAPVTVNAHTHTIGQDDIQATVLSPETDTNLYETAGGGGTQQVFLNSALSGSSTPMRVVGETDEDDSTTGTADLSEATAVTINELRAAFQTQRWLELTARAGARYIENTLAHFGVRTSDHRLQRPEYLGGDKTPVIISEVLQTSSTDGTSPQGNMAGHAFSPHKGHGFTKTFEEHGFVFGFICVKPRTGYNQQGRHRLWDRASKFDYYWPLFAHLGEQAVLKKEIFVAGTSADDETFGFAPRFDEYRKQYSMVTGKFREASLNKFHQAREFASCPELNDAFVKCVPTKRIHADTDEHACWVQIQINSTEIRPIPLNGTPGLIDHA